jgi:hypothetical protein
MKQVTALLGLSYALLNGYAAFLLTSNGLRLVAKETMDRGLLILGGLTVGLFALLLAGQCLRLLVSRG